jgi:hypothetical protein
MMFPLETSSFPLRRFHLDLCIAFYLDLDQDAGHVAVLAGNAASCPEEGENGIAGAVAVAAVAVAVAVAAVAVVAVAVAAVAVAAVAVAAVAVAAVAVAAVAVAAVAVAAVAAVAVAAVAVAAVAVAAVTVAAVDVAAVAVAAVAVAAVAVAVVGATGKGQVFLEANNIGLSVLLILPRHLSKSNETIKNIPEKWLPAKESLQIY